MSVIDLVEKRARTHAEGLAEALTRRLTQSGVAGDDKRKQELCNGIAAILQGKPIQLSPQASALKQSIMAAFEKLGDKADARDVARLTAEIFEQNRGPKAAQRGPDGR